MRSFALLTLIVFACSAAPAAYSAASSPKGERIYRDLCADCHGPRGEGVAGKYDEALFGTRSLEALARYIDRRMPEDAPEKCVGDDARSVAEYIHGAFYSPEARARLNPPTILLSRLTNRQYRQSVADLVGSFTPDKTASQPGGLSGDYFQSDGMNKKARKALSRVDPVIRFDFGTNSPGEGITADQFSIAWEGAFLAPDTGTYEFRLKTPNGARFYLNADLKAGDANLRDDSDARRHHATIDLWVSSGEMREASIRLFLLGGRSYPVRLDFFKYKEKAASIELEWKPPHGVWAPLSSETLSPQTCSPVAVVATAFPPDDSSMGFERGTAVSKSWQEANAQAAIEVASQVMSRLQSLSGVREESPDRKERLKLFVTTFAERAFRRPLTSELRELYVDRHFHSVTNTDVAVRRAVMMVAASPRFLYPELGGKMDSYAVASRLALALWDSLPDRNLLQAAQKGDLAHPFRVREEARRMLQDPRARSKLREFFHHWLMMEEGADMTKDTTVYQGFDAQMIADLRHSLDCFIEEVVWGEKSDYRNLLLADYLYLNDRLAAFYGAEAPVSNQFEKVVLPVGVRAGVFTHPYLLATLSYHRSSSPIHRGVFLTRNVLGRFLKPPPMAISFMDDRFDPSLTMREKVTELTRSETCMGCHVTINPLGFSLENYDAAGRWRTLDNNKPVDSESDYLTADGEVIRLKSALDVARHAVTSEEARRGFVRHLFHYSIKQTPAAYSPDTLEQLEDFFVRSNYHIRDLVLEIAAVTASHDPSISSQASQ